MVGTKLILDIKSEYEKYLGIPYSKNEWKNQILKKESVFAGKGSWSDIEYATRCAAEKEGLDLKKLSEEEIYNLRKRNRIGIDCSGLVYHLLNRLDQLRGNAGILFKVTGIDKPYGIIGVRSVSAAELTHKRNAVKIEDPKEAETGDMIRMDGGKHILMIINVTDNEIKYIHSSDRTKIRGVHLGKITLKGKADLNHQEWSDETSSGQNYCQLYVPEKGDGIYRLKAWL